MKKKIKQLDWACCMCYVTILLSAHFFISQAGVREDMGCIPDSDSLKSFYENNNDYVRRYVLKDLTGWLKRRGLPPDMPDWVYDALDDAFNSYRPLLIKEAAVLTGRYHLDEYADRLAEIYNNATKWFPADADIVRTAVLHALRKIGGVSAETYIPHLFLNSQSYMLSNEFEILLTALTQYGDSTCIEKLDKIEQRLDKIIAGIPDDIEEDPSRRKSKCLEIRGYVSATRDAIVEKGGGYE